MFLVLSKAALVMLAGIYAMRGSSVLFVRQPFQPLMIVAVLAFLFSVTLFYRAPTKPGAWLYTVLALCLVGVVANGMLYFKPDASHSDPTNLTFSALSIVGWGLLAIYFGAKLFASGSITD
jgi:hypothetical protein